ncbi:MAG: dTMP kinase [Rhodospirillaceae bacterium]|nr:dTMP kinase [Rhodospirillaceae bacterium]
MVEKSATRGRFVTFEGGEGVGKSTQVRRLARILVERGLRVVTTREPGGSEGGEQVRQLLVRGEPGRWDAISETLLLLAARRDHWTRLIDPNLREGAWVISDRFTDSTLIYQGIGRGVDRSVLDQLHHITLGKVAPDLTIVLDLPVHQGLGRTRVRNRGSSIDEDRFERMGLDFHERLRTGFRELAVHEPERIKTVDATNDADTVASTVISIVNARFQRELSS